MNAHRSERLTLGQLCAAHEALARNRQAARRKARRHLALAAAAAVILGLAAAAAFGSDYSIAGWLEPSDPTYRRPYLFEKECALSSIGTAVAYDVVELVLGDVEPIDLASETCGCADFDTVLYLYQRADLGPGAFDAAAPCTNLIRYDDDDCGRYSRVSVHGLQPGHVTVVLTAWRNGQGGRYAVWSHSSTAALRDFIFYAGFEGGDARTWSRVEAE